MASKKKPPSYSLHKASGNARVWLNGQDVYLGEYQSQESLDRYDDLIRQWRAAQSIDKFALTVDDLCLKYLTHADA